MDYITPGSPMQNGFVDGLASSMRDELLNKSLFLDPDHARNLIAAWMDDFNTQLPHSSLGYLTPAEFAEIVIATGSRAQ